MQTPSHNVCHGRHMSRDLYSNSFASTWKDENGSNGALFLCWLYRGHEVRPCSNHCTTCVHNSGLVDFELPRLSRPGITWRWILCNDTHVITVACRNWFCISTTRHNTVKYSYVMALLSLCVCVRSATHDMIKTHTTCAYQNTSSAHGLFHMKRMHHKLGAVTIMMVKLYMKWFISWLHCIFICLSSLFDERVHAITCHLCWCISAEIAGRMSTDSIHNSHRRRSVLNIMQKHRWIIFWNRRRQGR